MNTAFFASLRKLSVYSVSSLASRFAAACSGRLLLTLPLAIVVSTSGAQVTAATHPGTLHYAPAIGQHHVAVILVNFSDNRSEPGTVNQAQAVLDGPVNDYFAEASYQRFQLLTDVFGWWTLPYSTARCEDNGAGLVSGEIIQEANQRGVDLSGYDHLVYVFNEAYGGTCSGAVGTVSPGKQGKIWRSWPGNTGTAEVAFDGTKGIEATIHELGHNLGLWHADRLNCGDSIIADNCTISHYGDIYDVMGSGPIGPHFNAFHKERLGWITPDLDSINRIETVDASGFYSIASYAVNGGTKALKIRRGPSPLGGEDYFYLEYRQPDGWDAGFRTAVYGGILVRLGSDTEADSSRLLDMTPEEPWDHVLLPGQVFHDPLSQIDIELIEANGSEAIVSITKGADITPPEVRVTAPVDGDLLEKGSIATLRALVTDESPISQVVFYVDGAYQCRATETVIADEYSCSYSVPKGKSQTLVIEARALDSFGSEATARVEVSTGDASGSGGGGGTKGSGRKK